MTAEELRAPAAAPAPSEEDAAVDPRPVDDLEREVARWAVEHRNQFSTRREFNLALCDRLAARGIPPLAGVLRRLGGKGTSTSQTEDVKVWYTTLSGRLGTLEAQIPLGARRQANSLVEMLWKAAGSEVEQRLAAPLREELAASQTALASREERIQALEGSLATESERSTRLEQELQQARDDLVSATQQAQQDLQQVRSELTTAAALHARQVDSLRDELAAARSSHAAEMRQVQERLERSQLAGEEERKRLLRQVDEARASARDWQTRFDVTERRREQLQERVETLLEQETRATAERDAALRDGSRVTEQLAQARAQVAECQQGASELRSALAAAQERTVHQQGRIDELVAELEAQRETHRRVKSEKSKK